MNDVQYRVGQLSGVGIAFFTSDVCAAFAGAGSWVPIRWLWLMRIVRQNESL